MSNDVLRSFSENASRLGMRLQESFSEHTRSLQKETFYDATDDKTRNIRKQLDSNSEREKLVAIKLLIALTSKGRNMAEYFAPVVKNVASANLELRKLVYIFLLRYAEQEPDLALLSINTFQKDLADPNPIIRAMALRVLSGIKIPMIANIVLLAIKKCAADISPYVRKVAALAVPKCYELDPGLQESLVEIIASMWKDRSPLSIGSVVVAFEAVCPTRLDLLHKYYRRLCKALVDVDEWGQVDLMNLLLRYARTMLPRPKDDEETDKDVRLLLTSAEPVFFSRNPAVVIAAARIVFYAGPPSCHSQIVEPLIRLTHSSPEVERIVLSYILASNPSLFASHYTHFLISCTDLPDTKAAKLRLLLAMLNYDNHAGILRELVEQEAVHEIGRCAVRVPECSEQCVAALLGMVDRGNDEAVVVLKDLVPATVVDRLAKRLDVVRDAKARATVVWLVGQYAEGSSTVDGLASYAPDVLRLVAKSFKDEQRTVKLQVITMAAKLAVLSTDTRVGLLTKYVLQLARYDVDWDVRDRTRMLLGLLAGLEPSTEGEREGVVLRREQVKLVLFEGKKTVIDVDEPVNAMIGTWSAITGKRSIEEPILPDWLERGVSSVLRDSEEDAAPPPPPVVTAISSADVRRSRVVASAPQKAEASAPWKSLDAFYEEETGEGSTDEDDDEDGSGSGEEGDTSESDGEEEDDGSGSGSQPGNSEEEEEESEDDDHRYSSRDLAS